MEEFKFNSQLIWPFINDILIVSYSKFKEQNVNTKFYKGDINTSTIFLDPPEELIGQINVVPEMMDVMSMAIWYHGGEILAHLIHAVMPRHFGTEFQVENSQAV